MKKLAVILIIGFFSFPATHVVAGGKGLMDPMMPGTWFVNFGFGPGTNWQGSSGRSFLPTIQAAMEVGMWEAGPGGITLGGEVGTSFFFTELIGINGEFGFNITYAQIGMVFKIK